MSETHPQTIVLGDDGAAARGLAEALGAPLLAPATGADDAGLTAWRVEQCAAKRVPRVVVCAGGGGVAPRGLLELDAGAWQTRAEAPFVVWSVLLGAASQRVADGGAIVAVAEAPETLDAAGLAPELGLGHAVHAWIQSIGLAESARGVRANTVTTSRLAGVAREPGCEILGAVRSCLSGDAAGIHGAHITARPRATR